MQEEVGAFDGGVNLKFLTGRETTLENLLEGRMPNGDSIDVFPFEEFIEMDPQNTRHRYAIVREDLKPANKTQLIVLAGGVEEARRFLEKHQPLKISFETPFCENDFDFSIPRARLQYLNRYKIQDSRKQGIDFLNNIMDILGGYDNQGSILSFSKEDLDRYDSANRPEFKS